MPSPLRTALAVVGLAAANVAAGRLITGPLHDLPAERRLTGDLRARGGAGTERLAHAMSRSSDTSRAIVIGLALTGLLLARRRGQTVAVPALAMSMASATHVVSSTLVGRERPGVERFGTVQPTSSFPSGHVGAMTALSVVIGRLAAPLPTPVRVGVRAALVAYLGLLGWSRIYNGQHHASDVLAGYANGAICGQLAWTTLNRVPDSHQA